MIGRRWVDCNPIATQLLETGRDGLGPGIGKPSVNTAFPGLAGTRWDGTFKVEGLVS